MSHPFGYFAWRFQLRLLGNLFPSLLPSARRVTAALAITNAAAAPVTDGSVRCGDQSLPYAVADVPIAIAQALEVLVLANSLDVGSHEAHREFDLKLSIDGFELSYRAARLLITLTVLGSTHSHSRLATIPVLLARSAEKGENIDALLQCLRPALSTLRQDGVHLSLPQAPPLPALAVTYKLRRLFCVCDQKALLEALGLTSPLSTHWCPWCSATKAQRGNLSLPYDDPPLRRTVDGLRAAAARLPQKASARPAFARDHNAGVVRAATLVCDDVFLRDLDHAPCDPLHLRMRCCERMLAVYRALLDNDDAVAALVHRLRLAGVHDSFRFVQRKAGASTAFKCSLNGHQCAALMRSWETIVVPPSPPLALTDERQVAAFERRSERHVAVWRAWASVHASLVASPDCFVLADAVAAVASLRTAIQQCDTPATYMCNSMHIVLFHLPRSVVPLSYRRPLRSHLFLLSALVLSPPCAFLVHSQFVEYDFLSVCFALFACAVLTLHLHSYFLLYGSLLQYSQQGVESTIYRTKFFAKRRVSKRSLALREPLEASARSVYRTLVTARSGKLKSLRKTGPKPKLVLQVRKRKN